MGAFRADTSSNTSTTLEDQQQQQQQAPSNRSSSSFFSRFALPIRSRARNLADFHIRPAEPHRKYAAGDHVTGAVILTIVKPIRITHLTVALHGFVRVYKNPNAANEPFNPAEVPSGTQSSSRSRYLGNGHASLFQDEQVLSADGRLEPGRYEFNFDLMFPSKGLPSSIDFERGTISYMISATLTRPTSISPTTSCERKVMLVEQVDIGPLVAPRPRTIYLEPISKRSKRKKTGLSEKSGSATSEAPEPAIAPAPAPEPDPSRPAEVHPEASVVADETSPDGQNHPRSPIHSDIRSEVSGDSAVSGSTGLSTRGSDPAQTGSLSTIQPLGGKGPTVDERTITARVELLKAGCLPGDTVSVKISVQHIKRIKSLHGVIVTLYRQGRVDSAPPVELLPNLSKEDARKLEKDEYYPRSKTGLGGLSLTSAGSCSVFRKDLAQTFSPLIIDPVTLTATVISHIRVPEDVFPTIKGVPGEMISFKYRLEVIVDLGGKLANQLQTNQSSRTTATAGGVLGRSSSYESAAPGLAAWNGALINTDPLKREKGVIVEHFEIVVGTSDSHRSRNKAARPAPPAQTSYVQDGGLYEGNEESWQRAGFEEEAYGQEPFPEDYGPFPPEPPQSQSQPYPYWNGPETNQTSQPAAPFYVPPPEIPDDRNLSEKERVRRAEQRLLPSEPLPPPQGGSSSNAPEENIYDADDAEASASAPPSAPTAPPAPEHVTSPPHVDNNHAEGPSAPNLDDISAAAPSHSVDDKQELERQRLLAEASAPPDFPEDYDAGVGSSSAPPSARNSQQANLEPSAPVLSDEEDYGENYSYAPIAGPSSHAPSAPPAEPLPRYER